MPNSEKEGSKSKSYYQFQWVNKQYTSKCGGKEKKSCKTERVQHNIPVTETFKNLSDSNNIYLCYCWEIENEKVKGKNILQSADTIDPIFHMDLSKNISGTPKYEVESAHFNKS